MPWTQHVAASLAVTLLVAGCARGSDPTTSRVTTSPVPTLSPVPAETPDASSDPQAPADTPSGTRVQPGQPATPQPTASQAATPDLTAARVTLTRVASLEQPLAMQPFADNLYVAEKGGRVRMIGGGQTQTVLDISSEVSGGSEQGLLGLAFLPDGSHLYVHFTNTAGDTRLREYAMSGGRPDPASGRTLLSVDQPFANHNGGQIAFGPDGKLYMALGDGGSGGDPRGHAQSRKTLLGKLLRIDPRASGGQPYTVPPDNPFVGTADARGEIWAYGLRNPWRFSFDRENGDLWIADVGQNAWEEVNLQPASSRGGENYGWNRMEGTRPYRDGSPPPGHVPPVYEYSNDSDNCSITSGYVYRGLRVPALRGAYVFADFCAGRLRAIVVRDRSTTDHRFLGPRVESIASFGQDQAGELYVLSLQGGVYRIDPE